jgi:hypothetical protein
MNRAVAIALVVLVLVAVPIAAGMAAGYWVRRGDGYRQIPAVAWICCLGIVGLTLVVVDAVTPQTACQNTGCDTGSGVGMAFLALIIYWPILLGVWLGRRRQRERQADLSA